MRFIELFAGIGGFRYGLEGCVGTECANEKSKQTEPEVQFGRKRASMEVRSSLLPTDIRGQRSIYTCVWANEIDNYACQIYRKNFGEGELYEGDITKVKTEDIPDHDLITTGFPCQAFSIAGKRGGFQDTRGTLFFEIARIAREKQPRLLLLENVKGLLSHAKGRTFGTILTTLDEIGYDCQWQVLNSKNFGVPQNRERVFIIGHLRGTSRPKVFPIGESNTSNLSEITQEVSDAQRIYNSKGTTNALTNIQKDNWLSDGVEIRRLTPTECERLQGFPDGWTEGISDTQRYKCLGNAVTTNVITVIGERLIEKEEKK